MDSLNCLMDVERFVEWTYKNADLFTRDNGDLKEFNKKTRQNWRQYKMLPLKSLKLINDNFLNGFERFETVSVSDLLLCVNLAKDHSRGKVAPENVPISSTGRKVLTILLLGRMVENEDIENAVFTVPGKANEDQKNAAPDPLYERLRGKGDTTKFYYFPGRTVSFEQICNLGKKYKNNITKSGVMTGIEELVKRGLVLTVDEENRLYKLSFEGCRKFLEDNKE